MKKIIYWLFMLPLFALLNGCDDTDTIIFDDELPQFEIKANAIAGSHHAERQCCR